MSHNTGHCACHLQDMNPEQEDDDPLCPVCGWSMDACQCDDEEAGETGSARLAASDPYVDLGGEG